jgi:hypothetical protein
MKKRFFILSVLIVIFNSCNHSTKEGKKPDFSATSLIIKKKLTSAANNKLTGRWGIYETVSNGIETNCNVCPTIEFFSNQAPIVLKPNGQKETWHLKIVNNMLLLTSKEKLNVNRLFADTLYEITVTHKKEYMELVLQQKEKSYSYILRQ